MNAQWLNHVTEGLANLTGRNVLLAVGVMVLLLAFFRLTADSRDQTMEWIIENIQVVLSVVVVVFLVIRPFLFQAFYIPSSSMEPTLMGPPGSNEKNGFQVVEGTGDRLLVNKLIYRLSNPHRLDIAVFRAPKQASAEEKEFIKRVIGLPKDTVEVIPPRVLVDQRNAVVLANEGAYLATSVQLPDNQFPRVLEGGHRIEIPTRQGDSLRLIVEPHPTVLAGPSSVLVDGKPELQADVAFGGSQPFGSQEFGIQESGNLTEFGGDGSLVARVFKINGLPRLVVVEGKAGKFDLGHVVVNGQRLKENYIKEAPLYAMAPRKLGPDEYFMMGDNRNNSNDSHAWGPLKRERFIGRAEILFWPLKRFRIFDMWLIGFLAIAFVAYQFLQRLLFAR